jgi:ubiquinone/menaquinone biosynthesis C-methylase UbiE
VDPKAHFARSGMGLGQVNDFEGFRAPVLVHSNGLHVVTVDQAFCWWGNNMTENAAQEFDKQKARAFMGDMMSIMNGGAMALMCSIGHRTGLFDTMAGMESASSADIAAAAGLAERPVREWLGGVTVGGIVEHDPESDTYRLPAEHSGLLTRAAGTLNMSNGLQFIAQLGAVEDEVVASFSTGAGVPYSSFGSFQRLMAEVSTQRFDNGLLQHTIPLIGAQDALRSGIVMADVGCGSGHAVNLLAKEFPDSTFHGFDISVEGIERAQAQAAEMGVANASFDVRDVSDLAETARFDLITTFDAIHDQGHPDAVLKGIYDALKVGGSYLCVEPQAESHVHGNHDRAHAPFLYTVSTMHCMQVSLAADGEGVGAAWGREMIQERLVTAGFTDTSLHSSPVDRTNDYYLSVKG